TKLLWPWEIKFIVVLFLLSNAILKIFFGFYIIYLGGCIYNPWYENYVLYRRSANASVMASLSTIGFLIIFSSHKNLFLILH
ncbi:MAG: hypothetical protein PVI90_15705, partial [Desulfobacteraceae bacterium]